MEREQHCDYDSSGSNFGAVAGFVANLTAMDSKCCLLLVTSQPLRLAGTIATSGKLAHLVTPTFFEWDLHNNWERER